MKTPKIIVVKSLHFCVRESCPKSKEPFRQLFPSHEQRKSATSSRIEHVTSQLKRHGQTIIPLMTSREIIKLGTAFMITPSNLPSSCKQKFCTLRWEQLKVGLNKSIQAMRVTDIAPYESIVLQRKEQYCLSKPIRASP